MRSVIYFVRYNLKRMFTSPKPYFTFLIIFFIMQICFSGAKTYLTENDQAFQAVELFVFALSSNFFQIVCILGLLFLLGDAPFLKEGMSFRLLRTTRIQWLAGQMLSCIAISAVYLIGIAVLFVLLFFGQITFRNEWSDSVRLAAQVNTGGNILNINAALYFTMTVLQAGTPYSMFGLTLLYNLLLYALICLLVISCNLKCASGVGFFGVMIILGVKLMQFYVFPYKWLWNISPCSIVCLGYQSFSTTGVAYTTLFLTTICCCLIFLSCYFVRDSDLIRGDYA